MGWMADIHPDDLPRCKAFISLNADAPLHQRYEVEYRLRRADGSYGWVADTATPYVDLAGKFQGYIGYCWDIDQRKNTEEQIRHLAFYDSLTRLPNRRLLSERLTHAITVSKRDQRYGAAIFLDLDNFKPLNDTYGHGVGDMLLIEVAHRISGCMREVDTVARFGGDEFILVLNGLDANRAIAMAEAGNIADKIRLTLAEPYHLVFQQDDVPRHIEHHCTSSIGVMLFLGASVKQKDILRCADIAMYRAKEGGRNMLVFYE
jgi:diguanylate cyclase (GGDEF)-like protein